MYNMQVIISELEGMCWENYTAISNPTKGLVKVWNNPYCDYFRICTSVDSMSIELLNTDGISTRGFSIGEAKLFFEYIDILMKLFSVDGSKVFTNSETKTNQIVESAFFHFLENTLNFRVKQVYISGGVNFEVWSCKFIKLALFKKYSWSMYLNEELKCKSEIGTGNRPCDNGDPCDRCDANWVRKNYGLWFEKKYNEIIDEK